MCPVKSNRSDSVLKRRLKQRLRDASNRGGTINVTKRINKAASLNIGRPGGKQFTRSSQHVEVHQDESGRHQRVRTEKEVIEGRKSAGRWKGGDEHG
jgi:hypothetical protein